jgi:hypothetical protein
MSLTILPEFKFTRKNLCDKCHENSILARAIQLTAKIKMIYDLLLDEATPDIQEIASLPYEQRVALIFSYTTRYPGYGTESVDQELLNIYQKGLPTIIDSEKDLSQSIITHLMMQLLIPQSEGEVPMRPLSTHWQFPKEITALNEYIIDKDTGTGLEFLIKI